MTNWKNFPTTFVNGDYSRLFKESAPIKFSSGENNNREISYLYIEKYNENNNYNNFERLRNCALKKKNATYIIIAIAFLK